MIIFDQKRKTKGKKDDTHTNHEDWLTIDYLTNNRKKMKASKRKKTKPWKNLRLVFWMNESHRFFFAPKWSSSSMDDVSKPFIQTCESMWIVVHPIQSNRGSIHFHFFSISLCVCVCYLDCFSVTNLDDLEPESTNQVDKIG